MKLVLGALRLASSVSSVTSRAICTTPVRYHSVITQSHKQKVPQFNLKLKQKFPLSWKQAVAEAEKIVGNPKSFLNLRWLFDDDFANIEYHLKKLVTTNHPLLNTVNGEADVQSWGLVVLLVSRAAGHSSELRHLLDTDTGVLQGQRTLAKVTEMIFISHMIHKSMVNINPDDFPDPETLEAMTYGNKTALLSGDFILAKQCVNLATLKNTELDELMSRAERDLIESEFIGERDRQNRPLYTAGLSELDWTERNGLAAGSLLAKGCQGALMVADRAATEQQSAYTFGYHLALAWQACLEAEALANPLPAAPEAGHAPSFSLTSAPVIFALQHDAAILAETNKGVRSVLDVDYKKLRELVLRGPGLDQTRDLQRRHAQRAHQELQEFAENEASVALSNITLALAN